jgi:tRNA(fMet)-specific endonuclease VapC
VSADPVRPAFGLLDTSVVIGLADVADPGELPARPLISTVTLAELSLGPLVARDDTTRATRQATLQQAEASFDPLPFDAAAARAFARVAADLRTSGRRPAARAFDALIAATALANGLPLYTADPRDVAGIGGLEVREVRSVHVPGPTAADSADVTA